MGIEYSIKAFRRGGYSLDDNREQTPLLFRAWCGHSDREVPARQLYNLLDDILPPEWELRLEKHEQTKTSEDVAMRDNTGLDSELQSHGQIEKARRSRPRPPVRA